LTLKKIRFSKGHRLIQTKVRELFNKPYPKEEKHWEEKSERRFLVVQSYN